MTSTGDVIERLTSLVSLFNRGSLDLPDGFLDRNAQFRLNGISYEESIGRSPEDPLVRLIARGPGAYRFLAKALRYAMPGASVALGALTRHSRPSGFGLEGAATLRGALRDSTDEVFSDCDVALGFDSTGHLVDVGVRLDEGMLARLRAARDR
jgi:hypothetical protein